MRKLIVLAALSLMVGATAVAQESTVFGVTVHAAPICQADEFNDESKALIDKFWGLEQKRLAGTLTEEEFAEGSALVRSGQCGLVRGGIPVVVQILDGTTYFGKFPDGITFVFKSSGLIRGEVR